MPLDGLEKAPTSFIGMLQGKKLRQDSGENRDYENDSVGRRVFPVMAS